MGSFGKRLLVTLFKCCENIGGLKIIVEIRVVLFKHWKLLFKQQYQTGPIFLYPYVGGLGPEGPWKPT